MIVETLTHILFLDIETVPIEPDFVKLSAHGKDTFTKRFQRTFNESKAVNVLFADEQDNPDHHLELWQEVYDRNVSLLAEYAKVACISMGYVTNTNEWKVKSLCGPDERSLLEAFYATIQHTDFWKLCVHNGKTFDLPFLVRRMLIHGMKIPDKLQIMGKKPWDITWVLDTQELWSLGDLRYFPSLDRICYAFGVQSPKSEMDGSQVASVFYSDAEERFEKIARYCECDIVALVLCLACMAQLPKPSNL